MKQRIFYIVFLLILLGFKNLDAQQVTVKASIDSTHILVGDQLKLILEIDKPKDLNVRFPQLPDTFRNKIEVVNRSKIDTVKLDDNSRVKLTQKISITAFDSGKYLIPPFYFRMKDGTQLDSAATRELMFQVHGMKIDTTKGPVDIKIPYNAPVSLKEVIPYILGIILIGALLFFIFYYIKWKKKNVPLFVKPEKPAEPAHVIALRELDRIKSQKLWQQEKIKQFYSEVADTIRVYIGNRFDIQAMEQTSAETIGTFRNNKELAPEGTVDQLQHILSLADLVKFAKYSPLVDDNNQTLMNAYFFVNQTKKEELKTSEKLPAQENNVDDTKAMES
jgi:hypothetical protein